ncbi:MAG: hypothetical protein Q8N39_05740 [Pelolinea sp.]|nr:hypothetical protein [Pelolinea sp.]
MQAEKENSSPENKSNKKIGHWRRIISLCLLSVYALIGWLRLAEALRYWDYLLELNIWPRPLYFAITGAIIGAGFTFAWIFLLLKLKFSGRFNRVLGGVFLVWFWTDRVWFSMREAFFIQLFTAFFITAVTLIWMFLLTQKTELLRKEATSEPQTGTGS